MTATELSASILPLIGGEDILNSEIIAGDLQSKVCHEEISELRTKLVVDTFEGDLVQVAVWLTSTIEDVGTYYHLMLQLDDGNLVESVITTARKIEGPLSGHGNVLAQLLFERKALSKSKEFSVFSKCIPAPQGSSSEPCIGFITYGFNAARRGDLGIIHKKAEALASTLSNNVVHSRNSRLIEASKELQDLVYADISIEEKIEGFGELLTRYCGMERYEYISFQKESSGIVKETFPNLKDVGIDIPYHDLTDGPVKSSTLINRTDVKTPQSFIVVPIRERAIAVKKQKISNINKLFEGGYSSATVNHMYVLFDKTTKGYLSGEVSDTDRELCAMLARQFQHGLSSAIYDRKLRKLATILTDEVFADKVDAKWLFESVSKRHFRCYGLSILEYRPGRDVSVLEGNTERPLPTSYRNRMGRYLTDRQTISDVEGSEVAIGFEVVDEVAHKCILEASFTNEYGVRRLVCFQINTLHLSETDFRVARYILNELKVIFKNHDSILERASEIAQIRHAIIIPLSAASNTVESALELYHLHKDDNELWSSFAKDEVWDELNDATQQSMYAKMLADSGKYLFLDESDLSLDKKPFDLDKLFKSANFAGSKLIDGRKIIPYQRTYGDKNFRDGSKKVPHGDVALLFLVLVNLLDNAVKYTLVSYSNQYFRNIIPKVEGSNDAGVVLIELYYEDNGFRFKVHNVGRYIPEAERSRILTPFGRGRHFMGVNPVTGTGIGLPASAKIVSGHSAKSEFEISSRQLAGQRGIGYNTAEFYLPYFLGGE